MTCLVVGLYWILGGGAAANRVWGAAASGFKTLGLGCTSAVCFFDAVTDIDLGSSGASLGIGTFLACNAMKFFP